MSMAEDMKEIARSKRIASVYAQIRAAANNGEKSVWISDDLMGDHLDLELSREGFKIRDYNKANGNDGWMVSWE